jgi:hypothetical protein
MPQGHLISEDWEWYWSFSHWIGSRENLSETPIKKNMVSYLNQSNEFSHLRWYHQANSCLVAIGQEGLIDVPVEQAAETQGVDLRNGLPLPILKGLVSAVSPFWNPLSANQHWKKYNMCSNHQLFEQHLIFNKPCEFWGQTNGK